ncbi:hypothetical protein DFS34DRAFT_604463 [Phlyctochytrium arcticum]|nr:hypothetical protein DFS34DRAFT_604463 [Phlyctochytrium arcticum]
MTNSNSPTSPTSPFDFSATYQLTQPPHPGWTLRQNQPPPASHGDTITIDPASLAKPDCYKLLISSVVPRPIALVSTVPGDESGVVNVAPYSYFNIVCHDPPTVMISANYGRAGQKDTLKNILATSQFVVNTMSEHFVESANHTTTNYPPETSEMLMAGLTPVASELIRPPRIFESAVSFECRVTHINMLYNKEGKPTSGVVLGEIIKVHVKEGVYDGEKGVVDLAKFRPLGRLGGTQYARVMHGFDLPRPIIDNTKKEGVTTETHSVTQSKVEKN